MWSATAAGARIEQVMAVVAPALLCRRARRSTGVPGAPVRRAGPGVHLCDHTCKQVMPPCGPREHRQMQTRTWSVLGLRAVLHRGQVGGPKRRSLRAAGYESLDQKRPLPVSRPVHRRSAQPQVGLPLQPPYRVRRPALASAVGWRQAEALGCSFPLVGRCLPWWTQRRGLGRSSPRCLGGRMKCPRASPGCSGWILGDSASACSQGKLMCVWV
mmetsp:Transcript_85780/g.229452  ORF Transcript_85780/g.229452 Transcript_85780/m.229452 type:complete len:214 (-) Transcript_85780:221-862(-)